MVSEDRPLPKKTGPENRLVAAIAYDGLCTFEFGVAVEVFGLKRPEFEFPWYKFIVCGADRGPLRALGGVAVRPKYGLDMLSLAGTIIIPGWRDRREKPPERLLKALRKAHARGCRILTICSGVFVLAEAGLLDGRRATTHWRYTEELQRRYPDIRVDPGVLYVDEGTLLTSAGSAAGIDLCLHLVRRDYGARVANIVAKRLVAPPHRDGGQSQYIAPPPASEIAGHGARLARLLDWAVGHLDEDLPVARLAAQAHMSLRTFERRFRQETGTTPNDWLTRQRLRRAQELLETTDRPVERISEDCGLAPETLRRHFSRVLRTSPSAYRRTFGRASAAA
jgi:AraC family transcriptional regulator, transcriptional activator FtrA